MENNMKELNVNEMQQVSGGLRTEMLNDEERAVYQQLLKTKGECFYYPEYEAAEKALNDFKRRMEEKYGKVVTSDEGNVRYIV